MLYIDDLLLYLYPLKDLFPELFCATLRSRAVPVHILVE